MKIFWIITGFPSILCITIWFWIIKDRKYQDITFKQMWKCNWGIYVGILDEWRYCNEKAREKKIMDRCSKRLSTNE